jgi:hypothetical protein
MNEMSSSQKPGLPQNAYVDFGDKDIEPELRQAAERSIAALVSRSTSAIAQSQAAEAELAKLTDAVNAPLAKLIHDDQGARQALEGLRTKRMIETEDTDKLSPGGPLAPSDYPGSSRSLLEAGAPWWHSIFATITDATITTQMRPPFNFGWAWHDGHVPFGQIVDHNNGRIGIDARSGSVDGGASGFVAAHVGVGIFLSTNVPVTAHGWSILEPGRFSYAMRAVGIGSNATAEGGVEVTALENGNLIASITSKWWRRRISANESASDRAAAHVAVPFDAPPQDELTWTMLPGRQYTFNVGIWAFSDRSTGIGAAGVQSLIDGTVTKIWISQ